MCKTVTHRWKELAGLDKPGDVTLTEDWTEFTGLDKTGDVQDSNRAGWYNVFRCISSEFTSLHQNIFNICKV